jgi:acyl-CoA hydrolase
MSWNEIYQSKLMSAQEAAKIIQSGDCFWFPLLQGSRPCSFQMPLQTGKTNSRM